MQTTRRSILRATALAPAALGLGGVLRPAQAAGPLKVAYVYVAPIGDAGWTYQHELGRRAVDAAYGAAVKTSYIENVSDEGSDSERVIRQLAADGNDLIFTTSFGYMNPTLKVAGQFPKTKFEHCTGYKRAANMATYSARFYEGRYLAGILAARMSKTGVIGYVAAFPIPEVVQGINAVMLGARSVNPKATIKLVWTSSWFDPGKERAAADTLIAQGADVITHHTDSTAVAQAGEEKGVYTIAYNSDMSKYGPKTCLSAVTMHWDQYYIAEVKAAMDGSWKTHDLWGGLKDDMVRMAPYNAVVPAAVVAEVKTRQEAMIGGGFHPFQGPIPGQDGATKVAAGTHLSDKEILGMNWFTDGVQGKV